MVLITRIDNSLACSQLEGDTSECELRYHADCAKTGDRENTAIKVEAAMTGIPTGKGQVCWKVKEQKKRNVFLGFKIYSQEACTRIGSGECSCFSLTSFSKTT